MTESHPSPPYASYAAITGAFVGGLAGTVFVSGKRRGSRGRNHTAFDFVLFSLAVFKASRTIARDEVTSFIREPFVVGRPSDPELERPLPTGGPRQAIGELVTCSRCVGTWTAAGLAALDLLAPRFARTLTWSLAGAAANDWLQAGFAAATGLANEVHQT